MLTRLAVLLLLLALSLSIGTVAGAAYFSSPRACTGDPYECAYGHLIYALLLGSGVAITLAVLFFWLYLRKPK